MEIGQPDATFLFTKGRISHSNFGIQVAIQPAHQKFIIFATKWKLEKQLTIILQVLWTGLCILFNKWFESYGQ